MDGSGGARRRPVIVYPRQRDEVGAVILDELRLVDEGPNVGQRAGRGQLGYVGAGEHIDIGAPFLGGRLDRRQLEWDPLDPEPEAVLLADGIEVALVVGGLAGAGRW